ncbi:nuclease-related domain-containing protein [Flavobacterium fluviale]|uniref:nuclease-related domain-containing protein n=1 Tax=Flavobacterium fluviale TaxID=2249356 RepID=UPI0013B44AFA|nr:nuclease-related domain-containing protein [Flavobacterium fluviale]
MELVTNHIDEFNSLNEIIDFQKNYHFKKEKIISDHNILINEEKEFLTNEVSEFDILTSQKIIDLKKELRQKLDYLNQQIEELSEKKTKIIAVIEEYYLNLIIHIKFWFVQILFEFRIILFKYQSKKLLSKKKKRLDYISENFQDAVNESSFEDLQKFEVKNEIIKKLNNTIYGAFGEQKVENELKKLSDDYILINDFSYTFQNPIKHDGDYIKTIQIDHLLITRSGVFLIETKNWSNSSINNLDLRSPVQQVLRTNYALFRLLSEKVSKSNWGFSKQNWGNRKIPIKNIIVFTNVIPHEQFQYTKILGLKELLPYIRYFSPVFTQTEVQIITDSLLQLSQQKKISSKLVL